MLAEWDERPSLGLAHALKRSINRLPGNGRRCRLGMFTMNGQTVELFVVTFPILARALASVVLPGDRRSYVTGLLAFRIPIALVAGRPVSVYAPAPILWGMVAGWTFQRF